MTTQQHIQLVNRTSRIRDGKLVQMMPALQTQISRDLLPAWGADAVLSFVGKHQQPDPAAMKLLFKNTSDEAGALGYHTDDNGIPEAEVFVEDDMKYGAEISVTASHELIEMLVDPLLTRESPVINGKIYGVEPGDPVESDDFSYLIGSVKVSNFTWPRYYGLPNLDGSMRYDQLNMLKDEAPAMLAGGYVSWRYPNGRLWHTEMMRHADGSLSGRSIRSMGRSAHRACITMP